MGPEQLAQLQERNKRTRARKLDAETAGAIVGKTRAATKALVGSEDVDEDDNPLIEDYFQESTKKGKKIVEIRQIILTCL